jgi:CheY-like chemotaxis protein
LFRCVAGASSKAIGTGCFGAVRALCERMTGRNELSSGDGKLLAEPPVKTHPLQGWSLLVVEHDVIAALGLADIFEGAGAHVLRVRSVEHALRVLEFAKPIAAVVSFRLGRNTSTHLCVRLRELGVPIVHYTRDGSVSAANRNEPIVFDTGGPELLVATVATLREVGVAPFTP